MQQHNLNTGFIQLYNRRLLLRAQPDTANTRQAVLILPPFAEEMNKTRHLLNNLMRQLSAQQYDCFLLDNYGTGDSEGDLDNATIDVWRADLLQLLQLITQAGYQYLSLVAVRFGVLQLFDLLNHHHLPLTVKQVVLWQPLFDTAKFWQQFARIKLAEAMAAGNKLSQKELEQQLDNGSNIEIAGYPISPAFYQSLLSMNTAIPAMLSGTPVSWFETSQLDNIALPVQKMREQLQQCCQLTFTQLKAEPYWQTAELANADELIAATIHALTCGGKHD